MGIRTNIIMRDIIMSIRMNIVMRNIIMGIRTSTGTLPMCMR